MTEESVLATLRRIPDRIILAVAARDLEMTKNDSCLCGWVIREHLAEISNVGASTVRIEPPEDADESDWYNTEDSFKKCRAAFGGTLSEWDDVYFGVLHSNELPIIESAYVRRLDEACGFKEVS